MSSKPTRSIFWFRRDLRLSDNPALLAALSESEEIVPVFVMDQEIAKRAGEYRRAYLSSSLRALNKSLGNSLHILQGDPAVVLRETMNRYGASSIHVTEEFAPYGVERDRRVEAAGISLTATGSIYAISPGRMP